MFSFISPLLIRRPEHQPESTMLTSRKTRFSNLQHPVLTRRDALQAGAISYLLKNVSADELAHAIREADAGRSILAPEVAEVLIHNVTHALEMGSDLTAREREVLTLMIYGLNNTQIAERLVVSRSTVKFHVSNILSKLSATSRTEAVALAMQHHLVAAEYQS